MKDELKESSWNENKKSIKKHQGFQNVPKEEQKNKPLMIKVTEKQRAFLKDYCVKKEITVSDLVRHMLFKHLKDNGEEL